MKLGFLGFGIMGTPMALRLAKAGHALHVTTIGPVAEELLKQGAVRGSEVIIGARDNAVVFDFDPSIAAGAEVLMNRRGHDARIDSYGYADRSRHKKDAAQSEFEAYVSPWNIDEEDEEGIVVQPGVTSFEIDEDDES